MNQFKNIRLDYQEASNTIVELLREVGFKNPDEWFSSQVYNIIHQPLRESKTRSKKSEQKDFWYFIEDKVREGWRLDSKGKIPLVPIESISFKSNSKKFTFKVDERILAVFSSLLGTLKYDLRSKPKSVRDLFLRNHSFYEIVRDLKSLIGDQGKEEKLRLTDRQKNILVYNFLSLSYPSYFPTENPNEPKLDTDQIKSAHIRSILKTK